MNGDEAEFDPLEEGLGEMLWRMGECPGAEALAGFAADSLPPGETSRIQAHVAVCGICDSLVERLRRGGEPVPGDPPGWSATDRRLRTRFFPRARWQRILLHPAVAYGIALSALVVALVVALVPGRQRAQAVLPAAPPIAMESVRTIDLNVTRGGHVPQVDVPRFDVPPLATDPREKFLLLSFLIDFHPIFRYAASLDGGPAGDVESSDGKGNFAVLFSRGLLVAGRHRLTVTEINPGSGKAERSFEFAFQL
jgi:hypothetical protein